MRQFRASIIMAAATLAGTLFVGCDAWRNGNGEETLARPASVDLTTSRMEITAGDTVTVAAQTRNLVASGATMQWLAPGGEVVSTEANDTIARIRFDNPGTYTVTARATSDDGLVVQDSITIRVRAVRPPEQHPMQDQRELQRQQDRYENEP